MTESRRRNEGLLDALLSQTFGTARLPDDQRSRHLADIRDLAISRNRGHYRGKLTEAMTVAAIALIAVTGIVIWQFVLVDGDSPGVTTGSLYALRDLTIVEIDPYSGETRREIDRVRGAGNCSFLIASPGGDLLAAGDFVGPDDQIGISVYSTSDGSLNQEIPVPNLLQPLGRCWSVAFSADGSRIFAYQYEIPPGGTGDDARYWLGTYDLDARAWLPEIVIHGCRGGLMQAVEIDRLWILCGAVYEIDITTGDVRQTFGHEVDGAAFVIRNGTLYDVATTQTVLVQDIDAAPESKKLLRGAPLDTTDRVVSGLSLGIDQSDRYLYVPVQFIDGEGMPAAAITVFDLVEDRSVRVITPNRPFHDIAYAVDDWTAFIATSDDAGMWSGVTRIDLESGTEHELTTGQIGNLIYVPSS